MFSNNKYTAVYYRIVNNAKNRSISGYVEKHHIIPKSLGGSNDPENLVCLTAREHFICHLLLIRMVDNQVKHKMVYAAWQLSRPSKTKSLKISSRTYEELKKHLSESYKGRKRKPFNDEWKSNMSKRSKGSNNNMYGKKHSQESKGKMSSNRKGKCTGSENPFYGKTHSKETIEKIVSVNKITHVCPHCNKVGASSVMKRWHFDRCPSLK